MAHAVPISVEQQIIQLYFRHFPRDQIVTMLKTGDPRASRCIREFRRTGIIPKGYASGNHANLQAI
jgi:hypothetical protein